MKTAFLPIVRMNDVPALPETAGWTLVKIVLFL